MASTSPCDDHSITALAEAALQADSSRIIDEVPATKHEDHCTICLDSISDRAITVPCNHYTFDFICLASWLQEHATCPLCKTRITAVEYDWRGPKDYQTYQVETQDTRHGVDTGALQSVAGSGLARRRPAPAHCIEQPRAGPRSVLEDPAITFRRYIYKHNLFSLHIGDNPISGFQTITPQEFFSSPALQRKARIWIRRELRVFQYLYDSSNHPPSSSSTFLPIHARQPRPRARTHNPEFLVEYIVAMLKSVDLRGADGKAQDLVTEVLGRRQYAVLFVHELEGWLRGPWFSLGDWDEIVQYETGVPRPKRRRK